MTALRMRRMAGPVLAIGAILFVSYIVLRSLVTAGVDPAVFAKQGVWVPLNALGLAGALMVLLALPAVYAQLAGVSSVSGLVGVALVGVAWLFFGVFLSLYGMLILPWLAEAAPSLVSGSAPPPPGVVPVFLSSLLAWLVGTVLLGIPFITGRIGPRWIGYLLPASALWMLLGNLVIAPSGPAASVPINLLSNLGPVLLSIALGYLGFEMWSASDRAEQRNSDFMSLFSVSRRGDGLPLPHRKE